MSCNASRLRLQHVLVQPVLVIDDGETLLPGPPVQPQALTRAGLQELLETWPERLQALQQQMAGSQSGRLDR